MFRPHPFRGVQIGSRAGARKRRRRNRSERGVALVVSLLLAVALSAIGASLLMMSNTETYASMNYRMMSQARYGAEAGVLRAVNHLMNTYSSPGTVNDLLTNYNTAVSPVTYNGQPVVLSAATGVNSNYPYAPAQTAFSAAAQGSLAAGATVGFGAYATLVSMRQIDEYGQPTPTVVQTWKITGIGSLGGTRPATVEVSSGLERHVGSAHSFGVFATQVACSAVNFGGGSLHDSYDSSAMTLVGGVPATDQSGGKVGTNGNATVQGNAQIYGTLSTPRTGVGTCKSGAIVALTQTGQATVHEGVIQLPQAITYPTPAPPNPMPPTTSQNLSGDCASIGLIGSICSGSPGNLTFDPQGTTMLLGNMNLNAGNTLRLRAGVYNVNSFTMSGNSNLIIESGPVVFNLAGQSVASALDFSGGTVTNPSFNPSDFKMLYAGTLPITVSGGTSTAAMIYAPNAVVNVTGGSDFYGSIVGSAVMDNGGTHFHYDRRLANDYFVVGNYVMSAFTWKKY
jgi:hypothetical protein